MYNLFYFSLEAGSLLRIDGLWFSEVKLNEIVTCIGKTKNSIDYKIFSDKII